jgi:hypothetical protein
MLDKQAEIVAALVNLDVTTEKLADRIADCVNEVDDRIRVREFVRKELAWVDRLVAASGYDGEPDSISFFGGPLHGQRTTTRAPFHTVPDRRECRRVVSGDGFADTIYGRHTYARKAITLNGSWVRVMEWIAYSTPSGESITDWVVVAARLMGTTSPSPRFDEREKP